MTLGAGDPLTEHLIRTTTAVVPPVVDGDPSAVPTPGSGLHARAGNAMTRTREALLRGACRAVAEHGTHVTMAQVARSAGVAKATLYNHLRTREDVLAAVAVHEVCAVIEQVGDLPLPAALEQAALCVCSHPAGRRLADTEPAVLAGLARVDPSRPGWARAEAAVRHALGAGSADTVDLVLRWLAGFLLTPADRGRIRSQARVLARAVSATA